MGRLVWLTALMLLLVDTRASASAEMPAAVVSPMFTIRNLGAFPGDFEGAAYGLNNWGDAVGTSVTFDPSAFMPQRPDLFANHKVLRFHTMPTETPPLDRGAAFSINDDGVAVGYAYAAKGPTHAAQFAPSATSDLGTLLEYGNSYALGINNLGQSVGYADAVQTDNGILQHATLYAGGRIIDLGTLVSGGYSYANAINDQGIAVGYASTATGTMHAVRFASGTVTDLGTPPGGASSFASGINTAGQVVGYAEFSAGVTHAALFANGTITDLGTLPGGSGSIATAINNLGQAVGSSTDATGTQRPVLFANGQVIDLGTFAGITAAFPSAINDQGQIVGTVDIVNIYYLDYSPTTLGVMWTPASRASLPRRAP